MTHVRNRADLPLRLALMSDIGTQIREARTALGMSQAELARLSGVDPRTVRRIESGESEYPAKAGLLQKTLRIGPYAPPPRASNIDEVLLREATVPELLQAIAARYGEAVRSGKARAPSTGSGGIQISTMDELPPDVAAIPPDQLISDWDHPSEGRSSG